MQADLAMGGELDRIAQQVEQDLANAQAVTHVLFGQGAAVHDVELNALVLRAQPQVRRHRLHQGLDGEGGRIELHVTRFDLGEVQDVVDDGQQGFTRM
jgi:hypothetical protein